MKMLITALLGASMMMPIAAQAQREDDTRRERRMEQRADGGDRPQRAPRAEAPAAQPQQQQPPQPPQQQVQQQPRDRGNWRGQPQRSADRGTWRGQPQQARGDGQDGVQQPRRDDADRSQGRGYDRSQRRGDTSLGFGQQQRDARADYLRSRQNVARDQQRRQGDQRDRNDGRGNVYGDNNGRGNGYGNDGRRNGYANDARRNDYRGAYGRGNYYAGQRQGQAWNRGWHNDNRYDWNRYRNGNSSLYRLPRYYAPNGWGNGYRRFSVGITLSSILWSQDYWIDDPYAYRLPEAYGSYRWVRYYDDALLIDLRSGQVVDTVYDIFY